MLYLSAVCRLNRPMLQVIETFATNVVARSRWAGVARRISPAQL